MPADDGEAEVRRQPGIDLHEIGVAVGATTELDFAESFEANSAYQALGLLPGIVGYLDKLPQDGRAAERWLHTLRPHGEARIDGAVRVHETDRLAAPQQELLEGDRRAQTSSSVRRPLPLRL